MEEVQMAKKEVKSKINDSYYDKALLKTGAKRTAIPDWKDQRCYSQKEMEESEYNKKPDKDKKGEY